MELRNQKILIVSLVVIAISIAYYVLIYLPKQQDITLRKQVYELCVKEVAEARKTLGQYFNQQFLAQEIDQKKYLETLALVASRNDEVIANCVEKRLQEYKR
ncbi:MAG: hypothetical protein AAB600_01965 [Patescibacteria group bacterium]